MSTEYTFDGLNEWEKNLAQIIDRQYPEEFKQMVIDIAEQALGKAKELTPVQTGRLRDAWNLNYRKRGDTYYIEVYNNVEYAEPVEYGHRMKGGGFKKALICWKCLCRKWIGSFQTTCGPGWLIFKYA